MLHVPRRKLLLGAGALAAYAALSKEAAPFWQSRDSNYNLSVGGAANGFTLKANASAHATSAPTTSAIDTSGANLLVVVAIKFAPGVTGASITDSKSNTWTSLTAQTQASDAYCQIFYCASPTVGTGHTFTWLGANTFAGVAVQAWSGANVTPFDVENGAGATATSLATGSVTPGQNNSLIIAGLCASTGSNTYAIDSGFTVTDSIDYVGGSGLGIAMAYFKQGSAAAINPTWSWITSADAAATIAVFKP